MVSNRPLSASGVTFVYDGACPMCSHVAQSLRIKKAYGDLHLINARESRDHPLVSEITQRGLDLDEGMVIIARGHFYHGKNALRFMARYGDGTTVLSALCKSLFWSDALARLMYPWFRGLRNWLLRHRNIGRIDNLHLSREPTFKNIFGAAWDDLPPVLRDHYANRPYTDDMTVAEGRLDVMCRGPIKWLGPVLKALGQMPAQTARNVPVTVQFRSERDGQGFTFNRMFYFRGQKPYRFRSRMVQMRDSEVTEILRFGLSWRMQYAWDGTKVTLTHRGYALHILGVFIPVPLTLLLGQGYAEETPVDDERFDMLMHITHPWWGKTYEYKGRFTMTKVLA